MVANADSITAAIALADFPTAGKVAILNFANAHQRGGGYLTGALAQEEDLCRAIPTLYPALCDLPYPLQPDHPPPCSDVHLVHTPGSTDRLPSPLPVTVISAAAADLRYGSKPPAYTEEMTARVAALLWTAHRHGCSDLILGAWGCGVFKNSPPAIASFFAHALYKQGWAQHFRRIIFAIPGSGRRGYTFECFQQTLLTSPPPPPP